MYNKYFISTNSWIFLFYTWEISNSMYSFLFCLNIFLIELIKYTLSSWTSLLKTYSLLCISDKFLVYHLAMVSQQYSNKSKVRLFCARSLSKCSIWHSYTWFICVIIYVLYYSHQLYFSYIKIFIRFSFPSLNRDCTTISLLIIILPWC